MLSFEPSPTTTTWSPVRKSVRASRQSAEHCVLRPHSLTSDAIMSMFEINASAYKNNISHSTLLHVGKPPTPTYFQDWVRAFVYFHGFDDLPIDGDEVLSSPFSCLGHELQLGLIIEREATYSEIYGYDENDIAHFNIYNAAKKEQEYINVECRIAIRGNSKVVTGRSNGNSIEFDSGKGYSIDLLKALANLVDGALVIEVQMKHTEYHLPFIPRNPSACDIVQGLYMDKESSDLEIEVARENRNSTKEEIANEPAVFYAHHWILKKAAPMLAELCTDIPNSSSRIHIPGISDEMFDILLRYIYGFETSMLESDTSQTKEIIEAANKFGVTNLKLEAEARFVFLTTITLENAMELLHFADSKNCALLKEVVMDFILKNKIAIIENKILSGAPESVGNDILAAIAREEAKSGTAGCDENIYSSMGISDLRRRAHEKGLDVDGSREMLISALQLSSRKRKAA